MLTTILAVVGLAALFGLYVRCCIAVDEARLKVLVLQDEREYLVRQNSELIGRNNALKDILRGSPIEWKGE